MKRMTGIILMTVGVIIFFSGLFIYRTSHKSTAQDARNNEIEKVIEMAIADGVLTNNEKEIVKKLAKEKGLDYASIIIEIENKISELQNDAAETEIVDYNKKNGDDFEKYIAQKFDKKYFKIKEWAGDKYVKGVYAETTLQPDLLVNFSYKKQTAEFSVECKWRSKYFKNGIEFATSDQFKRYQEYEKNRKLPVFIAIGVGGKGKNPEHFYIIPLKSIESNFILGQTLKGFEKKIDSDFFFDPEKQELK
jgi:hypothetical protein